MGKGMHVNVSLFRFDGTRLIKELKDDIIQQHALAMRRMLEIINEETRNFTGETLATFRKFRQYLQDQELDVDLKDFTDDLRVQNYPKRFLKKWHTAQKIANLANAGEQTWNGNKNVFSVKIDRQYSLAITLDFESGSVAFQENEDLHHAFENAKEAYKEEFKARIEFLFSSGQFQGRLKKFFHRATIRST